MYVSGRIFLQGMILHLIYIILFFILIFKLRKNNSCIMNKINLLFNFVLGRLVFAE